jgi:hypothetical protein
MRRALAAAGKNIKNAAGDNFLHKPQVPAS